jgi:serine protease Do
MRRSALTTAVFAMVLGAFMQPTPATAAELPDFTRLVRTHGPSVVNISTLQRVRSARFPTASDDTPGDLRGLPFDETPESDGTSLGSGLIISSDGYILTCAHVVEDAREIVVRLFDRREFNARLVGSDTRTDVALLKIEAGSLPAVTIGQPGKLQVGEWVLAIGSPFGFNHSATSGIVSAKGRSLPHENYTPFIQTDVAINPGNSGGPLFNLRGEVVGVNSQIYSRSGGFMGVSFAIPIDLAMRVAEQLKRDGRLHRGWLGVSPQEVTRALATAYGVDKPRGALIADILPDSPAARSDLRAGDIVLEYNGRPIDTFTDLPLLVGQTTPATRVKLNVYRRGVGPREVIATVGELRDDVPEPDVPDKAGVTLVLTDLTEKQRRDENLPSGARVEGIDLAARQAGLRAGDVVVEFDGKRVATAGELRRLLARVPSGKYAVLRVRRGQQALYVAIAPIN